MPQKTKAEQKKLDPENEGDQPADSARDRSYYYDDSHGYEDYDPKNEEDEECDD